MVCPPLSLHDADPIPGGLLGDWRSIQGLAGLRAVFRHGVGDSAQWLADGTADWFWAEAENAGIPLYVHAPGQVRRLAAIAERHPYLRIVVDQLGMSEIGRASCRERVCQYV